MIGKTLGHYEITGELGKGGMGEVYRAHDARLGRDVAVKVLPASLAGNPEVRARFEREAKTVSSLNHPNICVVHDVGREGDVDFLVMELVDGETLAQRLERGPLPTSDVLTIGTQIADALDQAHRAGVVHRDLKPGNIMLTRAGAKLMDFGLARVNALAGAGDASGMAGAPVSASPTVAHPLTAEGTIIGTFQYMAPEQLEGKEADERADLWALGCVLYEMAVGKRAFAGRTQASLIAAIMHTEPSPVSQHAPLLPPALDPLVNACLAKDPSERVQSAHDVKLQLGWLTEGASSTARAVAPEIRKPNQRPPWLAFAVAVVATAAVTAFIVTTFVPSDGTAPSSAQPQRFIMGSHNLFASSVPTFAPDGSYVVFAVRAEALTRLYRRDLRTFETAPIPGTEGGYGPFFSPDGAWMGFVTSDAIKKVPADGGIAQRIAAATRPNSGAWTEDGTIYFASRSGGEDGVTALARVPAAGGSIEVFTQLEMGDTESWLPQVLPDGETVLLSVVGASRRIVAVRPDGSFKTLVPDAFLGRYVDTGHLLYRDDESGAVLVVAFDPAEIRVTGPAIPLTEEVDSSYCFDVSSDGKLVYVPTPGAGEGSDVVWIDVQGTTMPATESRATWTQPRVSPDGQRMLLRKLGRRCELWMLDLGRSMLSRIVQEGDVHDAVWSPDGRQIAFEINEMRKMVTLTVEGPRELRTLAEGVESGQPESWGAGVLAYTRSDAGTGADIWLYPMDGSSPPSAFLATTATESQPRFSPDGRWIAYVSNEPGRAEVHVRNHPDNGTVWQVSNTGGSSPLWSRDGRALYFSVGDKLMVVDVETEPAFRVGVAREFLASGLSTNRPHDFDVAPDGRIVTVRGEGAGRGKQLRILLNWRQEMERTLGVVH